MPSGRALALVLIAGACRKSTVSVSPPPDSAGSTELSQPLARPWTGPHGGVPPFDRVTVDQLRPAMEEAMAVYRQEVTAIADAPDPPTFENTIVALEDAGRAWTRVDQVYDAWSNLMNTPEFAPVEEELSPLLSAFFSELGANARLSDRIAAVYRSPEAAGLNLEQQRLLGLYYTDSLLTGATLDDAGKKRLAEIDLRLSSLGTSFGQNVRADEAKCVVLETDAELAGLPDAMRSAAAAAAEACGHPGRWAVSNTRSAVADFLTYADRRDLREQVWRNYIDRGDHGDAHDNDAIITETLTLRAEKAKLLGFPTFAHLKLADAMVETPDRATALMEAMWEPAVARVAEEVAAMQAVADGAGDKLTIAPWDYRYYAEKVRKATYDFDDAEAKPYLQLDALREGLFFVAGELFGLSFAEAAGIPVYHPDVRVYEVTDRATGSHRGLWYFDPFARPGKYNGGQTDVYRVQERFHGDIRPIVSTATPFVKPGPGEPALVGWRDAQTLFHEFGHALHYTCSDVTYPSVSGGRVVDDYDEFPAELFELWLGTPEVLGRFTRHYQTGEPMPAALLEKINRSSTFNQGYYTADYLASALVEMKLHLAASDGPIDPDTFERDMLRQLGAPEEVGMRSRLPHFSHVFASDAYAAGYYRYQWAEMLAADGFEAFREGQGPFDPAVAARLRANVFSVGNSVDPFDGYRAFRGRDATVDALMRARGFPLAPPPATR